MHLSGIFVLMLCLSGAVSTPVGPDFNLPQLLIPFLALLIFIGLIIINFILYNRQGIRHPGGVIGSIIHYPRTQQSPHKQKDN